MEIAFIGDHHTATGFRLSGIKRLYGTEEGPENLKKILSEETVGVLILTERFAEDHRKTVENHRSSKKMTPIIVEVPDVSGPVEREVDPIRELIKRAIGTDVK
jgi:V/A-type H+/Na+-transporting ATPase subunit F